MSTDRMTDSEQKLQPTLLRPAIESRQAGLDPFVGRLLALLAVRYNVVSLLIS